MSTSRAVRDNGLAIVFGGLFLLALVGQAVAGHADYNQRQLADGGMALSLGQYLLTSSFAVDVAENWQSEYLQFTLYILATIWLLQRGSPESKKLDKAGEESDADQYVGRYTEPDSPAWAVAGGWRTALFSRSLGVVMGVIFLASWSAQAVAGWAAYNADQLANRQDPLGLLSYLAEPDFWSRTLQNWQSELLAVGSMAIFAVYLRQRGSPESKPVGAPHDRTADSG